MMSSLNVLALIVVIYCFELFPFLCLPCSFLLVCFTPLCLRLKSEGQHATGYLVQVISPHQEIELLPFTK